MSVDHEKETLERAIQILRHWRPERGPAELQLIFLELRDVEQTENVILWKELRSTLAANKKLLDKDLQFYIYEPELAKNGWWWYDCDQWNQDT